MDSGLKPCPFCGGEAVLVPTLDTTVREWFVTCGNLECNVLACKTKRFYTEAEAIEAWNTRYERTCRSTTDENAWCFACSECGKSFPRNKLHLAHNHGEINYCPNCKAKVVS